MTVGDIEDESKCILDFNARKHWRKTFPGACTLEYESMIQIVVRVLIGWDVRTKQGTNGIFGVPIAFADCCEEQARYTLHSHISIWIKDFNKVRRLLFNSNQEVARKAQQELELYFDKISQATLGDLVTVERNINSPVPTMNPLSQVLHPPNDQTIRDMRHHMHCKELHGIVGYISKEASTIQHCIPCCEKKGFNSEEIVKENTSSLIPPNSILANFNKTQLDALAYTYPFHMNEHDSMKPTDCRVQNTHQESRLEDIINQFNVQHPLLQLRFNIHDHQHRLFQKGR